MNDELFLKLCGNNHLLTQERLTDEDIRILALSLKGNTYVNAIDLRYNRITDVGAVYIAEMLQVGVASYFDLLH